MTETLMDDNNAIIKVGCPESPWTAHYWVTWGPVHLCPALHIARSRLGLPWVERYGGRRDSGQD